MIAHCNSGAAGGKDCRKLLFSASFESFTERRLTDK